MIIIEKRVFAIAPDDDPVNKFMREFDPEHVELFFRDTMEEVHGTTNTIWGIGLDAAERMFGPAVWVCPD